MAGPHSDGWRKQAEFRARRWRTVPPGFRKPTQNDARSRSCTLLKHPMDGVAMPKKPLAPPRAICKSLLIGADAEATLERPTSGPERRARGRRQSLRLVKRP